MNKDYRKLSLFILSILAMICISKVHSEDLMYMNKEIESMYVCYYSYSFFNQKTTVINILFSTLPILINVAVFSCEISELLKKNSQYIFIRTTNKKKWILQEFISLFLRLLKFQGIQFIIVFIYFSVLGYKIIQPEKSIKIIMILFILLVLTEYILILSINIFSLIVDNIYTYTVVASLYVYFTIIFNLNIFNDKISVKYIPFTQHIISVQSEICINREIVIFKDFLQNYKIIESVFYDIILIIFLVCLGIIFIRKKEFF